MADVHMQGSLLCGMSAVSWVKALIPHVPADASPHAGKARTIDPLRQPEA
jgi:hypothetical protein